MKITVSFPVDVIQVDNNKVEIRVQLLDKALLNAEAFNQVAAHVPPREKERLAEDIEMYAVEQSIIRSIKICDVSYGSCKQV